MSPESQQRDREPQAPASTHAQSFDAELEELAGLRVSEWFAEELQGRREVRLQAAIASSAAQCEVRARLDLAGLVTAQEVRCTYRQPPSRPGGGLSGRLWLQPHRLRAHLDLGAFAFPGQSLSPYLAVALPRNASLAEASASASVGAVYRFRDERRDARHAVELAVGRQLASPAGPGLPVSLTQNLRLKQQACDVGLWHRVSFADGCCAQESRLVLSKEAPRCSGHAQVGLDRRMKVGDFGFGACWKPWTGLALFVAVRREPGKSLLDETRSRCPVTRASLLLKDFNLAAGLDWQHAATGFGAKLAYLHRDRLSLSVCSPRNLGLRAALLLDRDLAADPASFGWGARLEFDC